jgi:hypothetical protein
MPFQFEFASAHWILRARFFGVVDDVELSQFYASTSGYVRQTRARVGVTDFSEVTDFHVSPAAVTALATSPPIVTDHSFVRIVVAPAPSIFGLSRMFQILGEQTRPKLVVVHTRDEAYAALGISDPQFEVVELK